MRSVGLTKACRPKLAMLQLGHWPKAKSSPHHKAQHLKKVGPQTGRAPSGPLLVEGSAASPRPEGCEEIRILSGKDRLLEGPMLEMGSCRLSS